MRSKQHTLLAGLLFVIACHGKPNNNKRNLPQIQTTLRVTVPFSGSGTVTVSDRSGSHWEAPLDNNWQAEIRLGNASGDFVVAVGPDTIFVEPRTGIAVSVGDASLGFPIVGVGAGETVTAVLDPWKPIAWQACNADLNKIETYDRWLGMLDELVAGCAADVETVVGYAPRTAGEGDEAPQSLSGGTLAHLCWGGLSELSARIARDAGLREHERITTPVLIAAIGRAAADGSIRDGEAIPIIDGVFLPVDILRQPLAQAIRAYADANANSVIRSDSILDVLRCLSSNSTRELGPNGEALDVLGPLVEIRLPLSDTTVSGESRFECVVGDESGISAIEASASRDDDNVSAVLTDPEISGLGTSQATFVSGLELSGMSDGLLGLECIANDRWLNRGTDTKTTTVNNAAGEVRIEGVDGISIDGAVVEGNIEFACTCSDAQATSCVLVGELIDSGTISIVEQTPQRTKYQWTTTDLSDGKYDLHCESASPSLESVINSAVVEVNNLKAIVYAGSVPFTVGDINVYRFESGHIGDMVATGAIVDSAYSVEVDTDLGPIVFLAEPSPQAQYIRLTTGQTVSFTGTLMRYENHAPGSEPQIISGRHFHAVTTLAVETCAGIIATHIKSVEDACADAHIMWDMYIQQRVGDLMDMRTVPLRSLLDEDASGLPEAVLRLAMWHTMLEELGAQIATDAGSRAEAIGWAKMTEYLGMDLEEAVLDGRDGLDGDTVLITNSYSLRTNTCRIDLARAGVSWIRRIAYTDTGELAKPLLGLDSWAGYLDDIAQSQSKLFGGELPESLDLTPPDLSLSNTTPEQASGTVRICILIDDDSTVTAWFEMPNGVSEPENATIENNQLCGDVDTRQFGNGTNIVVATAIVEDELGNRSSIDVTIGRVQNSGPTIEPIEPTGDAALNGVITFAWRISDPVGVATVTMSPEAFSEVSRDGDVYSVEVDTELYADGIGSLVVDVMATNGMGISTPARFSYDVDNVDAGSLFGCVFVDSPAESTTVHACALDLQTRACDPVASAITDHDGCFELTIPDRIQTTWILLSTDDGQYYSATTGLPVSMGDFEGLYHVVQYAPSRHGTELDNISINAYTSLAYKWAWARIIGDGSIFLDALSLMGAHIGRGGASVVLGRTYPRDFVTDSSHSLLRSDGSNRLALAQVALGWCGKRIAEASSASPDAVSTIDMLALLYEDAGNGLYDGLNATGGYVAVLNDHLDSHSLRWSLATCASDWLQSDRNTSSLSAGVMNAFLVGIAENPETRLFGETAPLVFDETPPIITSVVVMDALGNPIDLRTTEYVRGIIGITITAEDSSAFSDPPIVASGIEALTETSITPNTATVLTASYRLDTTTLQDNHEYTANFVLADGNGNQASTTVSLTPDNTPPVSSISATDLTRVTSIEATWSVDDIGPVAQVVFLLGGTPVLTLASPSGSSGTVSIALPSCNATHTLAMYAIDAAQNIGTTVSTPVSCDSTYPTFFVADTTYCRAGIDFSAEYVDGRIEYDDIESCFAIGHDDWPTIPVLHKYENRCDYLPDAGRTKEENNLPVINVSVTDTSPVDSTDIDVDYRYSYNGAVVRDWTAMPGVNGGVGEYELPIAYQTLLPDDATREENFIATSSPEDLHLVEIRGTDAAENPTILEFPFRLYLHAAPFLVDNCRMSEDVEERELQEVGFLYLTHGPHTIAHADIIWRRDLPEETLSPDRQVQLRPTDSRITSYMREYSETKDFIGGGYYFDEPENAVECAGRYDDAHQLLERYYWEGAHGNRTYSYADSGNCREGRAEATQPSGVDEFSGGSPNDNRGFSVVYDNATYQDNDGAFEIIIDEGMAQLDISFENEQYVFGYRWGNIAPFPWNLRNDLGVGEAVSIFCTETGRDIHESSHGSSYGHDWEIVSYISEFRVIVDDINVEIVIPSLPVEDCESCANGQLPNAVVERGETCAQEETIWTGMWDDYYQITVYRISRAWRVGEE